MDIKAIKRIKKIIIISVCVLGGGCVLFNFVFNFIIIQEAPCWDGIWSNQDESFILDTDDFYDEYEFVTKQFLKCYPILVFSKYQK